MVLIIGRSLMIRQLYLYASRTFGLLKLKKIFNFGFSLIMKKSRFTESQIIAILKQHESGFKGGDICREHGISQATFFN